MKNPYGNNRLGPVSRYSHYKAIKNPDIELVQYEKNKIVNKAILVKYINIQK